MTSETKNSVKSSVLSEIKFALVVSAIAGIAAGRNDGTDFEFQKAIGTGIFALLACLIVIAIGSLFHSTK